MTDSEVINKEPITNVAIRFQDCDPFGHLNLSPYKIGYLDQIHPF